MSVENSQLKEQPKPSTATVIALKKPNLKDTIKKIVKANNDFNAKSTATQNNFVNRDAQNCPVEFFPQEIVFSNVLNSFEYVATLTIQNIASAKVKFKLRLPKNPLLSFVGPSSCSLIPGFSQSIKISYSAQEAHDFEDCVTLICEDFTKHIPIIVHGPRGALKVDSLVELGYVQPDNLTSFKVSLQNSGQVAVLVDFSNGLEDATLASENFPLTLEPQESRSVAFGVVFARSGLLKGTVVFSIRNQTNAYPVTLTATVAAFSNFILDEKGNEATFLSFGDVLLGHEVCRQVTLVNNAPVPLKFRISIGKETQNQLFKTDQNLQTPFDVGVELSQQVIFVDPLVGQVREYGHQVVKFRFRKNADPLDRNLISKFALLTEVSLQEETGKRTRNNFAFAAVFNFDFLVRKLVLPISVSTFCPLLTVSHHTVYFGEQQVNSCTVQDVTICNFLGNLPLEIETSQEFFLHCLPKKLTLAPKQTSLLKLSFKPKNLGKYECNLSIKVAGNYEIRVSVSGSAKMGNAPVADNLARTASQTALGRNEFRISRFESTGGMSDRNSKTNLTMVDFYKKEADPAKTSQFFLKQNYRGIGSPEISKQNRTGFQSQRRIHAAGTSGLRLHEPVPGMPTIPPALYLIKPLKKGIPKQLKPVNAKFDPSPREFIREFGSTAKDYQETLQIAEKLTAEKLMRIYVGPTELNFGQIFAKSVVSLYFHVKNELWTAISVSLDTRAIPELKNSSSKCQIVPSSETASFKITLSANCRTTINENVKYTLNEQSSFYFAVRAQVILPCLELSRNALSFNFREDSLDISTSQTITLKNHGNLVVNFSIRGAKPNSPFQISPLTGAIPEGGCQEIEFAYSPFSVRDEEVFRVEIENGGEAQEVKCVGLVNEVSCEALGPHVNFGCMAMDQKKVLHFTLKNTHSKYNCIFKIDQTSLPEGIEIKPSFGKICTDESQKFDVEFSARRKTEFNKHEIRVFMRGSTPVKIYFSACILIPTVEIDPPEFYFQSTTIGNNALLTFEMTNKSGIQAEVHLNLQTNKAHLQELYDLVGVSQASKPVNDSVVLEKLEGPEMEASTESRASNLKNNAKKNGSMEKSFLPKGNYHKKFEEKLPPKYFVFYLKPYRTYSFNLIFSPSKPILYKFELLFTIQGQENQNCLARTVSCTATNPRFLFHPISGCIEFERQIMLSPESLASERKTFTIINSSNVEKLQWHFDQVILDQQSVFKLQPQLGIIDEGCSVNILIEFKPLKAVVYESSIPIFFDNKQTQSFELKLRGEGTPPKVLLSTEEVILPMTPLGVASFSYFSVLNDGYQNSIFSLLIPIEFQKIGLSANFVNGNMLGISNLRLTVRVSFISNTPTSFTAKIGIEDDLKHTFYFSVSGSTDNSLLSYAPFLQLGFFANTMFRKHLLEQEDLLKYDPKFQRNWIVAFDESARSMKYATLDRPSGESERRTNKSKRLSRISFDKMKMDDNALPYECFLQMGHTIRSWLVEYGVTTVINFPEDVVENDGLPFFEFLDLLVKSNLERPKQETFAKSQDRVEYLTAVYARLMVFLKENNALVNTVRPHFLLSHKDLLTYFKLKAEPHVSADYYQVTESQYKLLSIQSWTTLFLQSIKVFLVSRITLKDLKNAVAPFIEKIRLEKMNKQPSGANLNILSPKKEKAGNKSLKGKLGDGKLDEKTTTEKFSKKGARSSSSQNYELTSDLLSNFDPLPQFSYEACQMYTQSEAFVIRWLELVHNYVGKSKGQIVNMGRDLSNCYYFGCAIDAYVEKDFTLSEKMIREANLTEEVLANFKLFKNCAMDFGIKEEFIEADHGRQSPLAMMLTAVHLFKTLPSYVPKMTIEFNCALHEKMTKEISISNPTGKQIMYSIRISGSKNFEIEQDVIKIEAKQSFLVPVTFYAETSLPAEGRVFFQNRKNGKSVAGAIVFNLQGLVSAKYSMKVISLNSVCLYELGNTEIVVQNPFGKDVEFKVRLENVPSVYTILAAKKKKKNAPTSENQIDKSKPGEFLPSFFVRQEKLWIRKGGEAKLYLQYLPISNETHRCFVNFQDPKAGEMQYEIIGIPKPPNLLAEFKITVPIEEFIILEIDVPIFNNQMRNALIKLSERLKEGRDYSFDPMLLKMHKYFEKEFDVEIEANDYFAHPNSILVNPKLFPPENLVSLEVSLAKASNNALIKGEVQESKTGYPTFKYQLLPLKKVPIKDLTLKIMLKGRQRFDFRIYELRLSVLPKKIRAIIEIKTNARVPVVQSIPISNSSDADCTIRPRFVSISNGHLFDCSPGNFVVKKKSTSKFILKFASAWIESAECTLHFFNLMTNESFEYVVKAECEEPLSEEHFQFSTKAKSKTEIVLRVKNPMPDGKSFRVESDVPGATFERKVHFDESNAMEFRLVFVPLIGGNVLHSVTFFDESRRYFWYLISLTIDSPEPTRTISVVTEVRKPVAGKIELENPTEALMRYKVLISGDYLSSDHEIEIEANGKITFTFFYFPVKVENVKRKIGLLAEDKSEMWYDVDCRADEPKIIKLPILKSEIGKSMSQQLTFMNPLKKKVVSVRAVIPDNSNFKVVPRYFEIPPNDVFCVDLTFVPKDLNQLQAEIIQFISREIGNWNYQAFGVGVAPSENEPVIITTTLKRPITHSILWKNPFMSKIAVKIILESAEKNANIFEVVTPKLPDQMVPQLGTCHVTIKFDPTEISTYQARLLIRTSDQIQWVYPIKALAEAIQDNTDYLIRTKCETQTEVVHNFNVLGMTALGFEEAFDFSLNVTHEEAANIERWLKIKPVKNKIGNPSESLAFHFTFLPHKPLKASLEFVLTGHSGGRWKYRINLVATDPDFFDTLNIVSQFGVNRTIRFQLFNSDKKNANPFVARFEDDSHNEFGISPAKGMLEPKINDGNFFEISFCPRKYGKAKACVAIIETDQHMFRFLVNGTFEKYTPPK